MKVKIKKSGNPESKQALAFEPVPEEVEFKNKTRKRKVARITK